ncbi:unnamed protein product [Trichogramma brassicae]|uniref:Uncharacterized protein n=1 Tax=Trichogramma brassicae TaxID=86971 RepID=A0A6H5I0A2_9HYME|nr:unnamed protein product [Trichogramma brassicae]
MKKMKREPQHAQHARIMNAQKFIGDDVLGKLPQIERLLLDAAKYTIKDRNYFSGKRFIYFVLLSGYKIALEADEEGNPLVRRTTPIHVASRRVQFGKVSVLVSANRIRQLFSIYNTFDVNPIDEFGYTHFHVACEYGCEEAVQKYLELGRVDPNFACRSTRDAPLHLALRDTFVSTNTVKYLLEHGADANATNAKGSTPLHEICKKFAEGDYAASLVLHYGGENVRVDARDNKGRTPLKWAVITIKPRIVHTLLYEGAADLSDFVFPNESDFEELFDHKDYHNIRFKLRVVSGALTIVELLETKGHEINRSDAVTLMKVFAEHQVFKKSADIGELWHEDEEFANAAKCLMMKRRLSLHDLIRLRPKEAAKRLEYDDYYKFACIMYSLRKLPEQYREACSAHLCEKLSRGFYRSWALEPFWELIHYRLPLECCEMIVDRLENEDLGNVCLAAALKTSEERRDTEREIDEDRPDLEMATLQHTFPAPR